MSVRITRHLATADPVMAGIIAAAGPYRIKPDRDCPPFRALARAIAHQQLNGVVANRILDRFVAGCGGGAFPTPEQVLAASDAELRAAGFSGAKIAALRDLAAKTHNGVVPSRNVLETLADDAIVERLTAVRGIGRWTVEMMLMFQLGRSDVLPVDDFGVRNGFRLAYGLRKIPTPRALAAFGERWRPYRTAAAWYLWRAIELAKAGTLPAPAEKIRMPRTGRRVRRRARVRRASRRRARK
ncbi:MAG: DNA-3-methyladenine glycosylase family protein [Steroidobacteraceae bacterium]